MSKIERMFDYEGKTTKIIGPEKTETYKEIYNHISDQQKSKNLETHPNYLTCLHTNASVCAAMNKLDISIEIMDTVLNIEKEILGEFHPSYLLSLSNYSAYLEDSQEAINILSETPVNLILSDIHMPGLSVPTAQAWPLLKLY